MQKANTLSAFYLHTLSTVFQLCKNKILSILIKTTRFNYLFIKLLYRSDLQFCFCLCDIDFSVYLLPVALLECLLSYFRPAWNWLFMLIRCQKYLPLNCANPLSLYSSISTFLCLHSAFLFLLFYSSCLFRICLFSPDWFIVFIEHFVFSVLIYSVVRENDYQPTAIFKRRSQSFPCEYSLDTRVCVCARVLV